MVAKDGRVIAHKNEMNILRMLSRFGWLRTRDIAALVWLDRPHGAKGVPSLKPAIPSASGLRMAQRTLRRMQEKRLLLKGRASNGSIIYALAEAGVRVLDAIGVTADSGKDQLRAFSSAYYLHRNIANDIAIGALMEGFRASTEREISQGVWIGGEAGIAGKRPDVLIRTTDQVYWVEVERSRKNAKDYAKLLNWLTHTLNDAWQENQLLDGKLRWGKVVFVCTPAFKKKLCRDLEAKGWKYFHFDRFMVFETTLYKGEDLIMV